MPISDPRSLRQKAAQSLRSAPNGSKLVLIFAGVAAGLSLAAGIVSMILDSQIAGTGGLSGMQLRSVLSTIQSLLNILIMVFVPFWSLGYTSVVLKLSRGEDATETDLLNGFRRFGPGLRLMLLRQVIGFAVAFAAFQVASIAFSMTPWAVPFYEKMELGLSGTMDEATMAALTEAMIPLLVIVGALYFVAMIPVTYRLRMAEFQLMDEPKYGALLALLQSNRMMKGNCLALFKLDLHFWWYYLANILVTALCYGDMLLPLVGIHLPIAPEISFVLFYVVAQGAQILLYWRCRNQVDCTYAVAYDALQNAPEATPQPPKNVPWNY